MVVPADAEQGRDACLAILVRAPEAGQVKALAGRIEPEVVLQLYKLFVRDLLTTVGRTHYPFRIFFYPGDARAGSPHGSARNTSTGRSEVLPWEAYEKRTPSCLVEGFRKAAVIGSDSPDLPAVVLAEAFSALDTHDAVIGPATDGGYYLIGFKDRIVPGSLQVTTWGEPDVFVATMGLFTKAGSTVRVLDPWPDIDTVEDLQGLCRAS